ncbi:MAG: MoaD/ThiS family protein [Candidatus Thermoplasmatota archaeon]|jgi:sulfur carrier protein ThiS|nr:MoaD/ThiS family protein [Candidatus Thermoplasmatota archaeon]
MIYFIGRDRRTLNIERPMTIKEAAKMIGVREASVVFLKNGRPVTSDEMIGPEDEIKCLEIFSGG